MQRILAISPYLLSFYLALLFWLSLSPARLYRNIKFPYLPGDTAIHFVLYFILSFLLFFSILRFDSKMLRTGVLNIVAATAIGFLMEVLQLWFVMLNRSFEWKDVMMNFAGAFSGTLICLVIFRMLKFKPYESVF